MESVSIGESSSLTVSGKSKKKIYDWSSLPPLLLWMATDKLDALDNKSFAAVCRDWRSASNSNPKVLQSVGDGFQWITFGYLNKSLEFFSVGGDRKFKVDTPQSGYYRVLSSKRGWILLLKFNGGESSCGSLFLVNFFSGDKIELPPCPKNMYSAFFTTNSDGYPQRAFLLTLSTKIIKSACPGDGNWTDHTLSGNRMIDRFIPVGDRFYSLYSSFQLITTTNVADRTSKILPRPARTQPGLEFIVEHEDRLMFVYCVCDDEVNSPYKFRSFDLYTYNHVTSCWIKMRKDEVKDTNWYYHKYRGCLAAKGKGLKIYHLLQEVSTAGGTYRTWVEVYDLLTGSREIRNLNHQIDGLACWVDIG